LTGCVARKPSISPKLSMLEEQQNGKDVPIIASAETAITSSSTELSASSQEIELPPFSVAEDPSVHLIDSQSGSQSSGTIAIDLSSSNSNSPTIPSEQSSTTNIFSEDMNLSQSGPPEISTSSTESETKVEVTAPTANPSSSSSSSSSQSFRENQEVWISTYHSSIRGHHYYLLGTPSGR
jgi:hypothetical protein